MGITQAVLYSAYTAKIVSHNNVRKLTKAEAMTIYQARFWNPYNWSRYSSPVDMIMFDSAVNNGPGNAVKIAQRACVSLGHSIVIDGAWGPQTRNALYALAWSKGAALSKMLIVKRVNFFNAIVAAKPSQEVFLKGWLRRANDLAKTVGIKLP